MEYTVSKLAKLSGVSTRTLRYYDEIDLLKPKRVNSSGYRIYGKAEVDLLQQILFYRELEMSLSEIKQVIQSETFDIHEALKSHLSQLSKQRNRLDALIETVEKSLKETKGEMKMTDKEKFEAFKKDQIDRNEEQYGKEIREKYGEDVLDQSNKKITGLTTSEYQSIEQATEELNRKLGEATRAGDPASELGQEIAKLHQNWIQMSWPKGYYDEQKHYNLSSMYIEDERFKAYYEKIAPGAAEFLQKALKEYLDIEIE